MEKPRAPSRWRIADALKMVNNDPTTTMPVIPYNFPVMSDTVLLWDSGQIFTMDNKPLTFKGWKVLWSLCVTKPESNADIYNEWLNRNNSAFVGYWYAREGTDTWTFGGRWFKESANMSGLPWEWSGGPRFRENTPNTIDWFYTDVGPFGDTVRSVISHTSGQIFADENGVWFDGFDKSVEMFEADGINYANAAQNPYFNFRDPFVFRNPENNKVYCLFEGNVAGMRGDFTITSNELGPIPPGYAPSSGAQFGAAAIGIAELADGAYEKGDFTRDNWNMLPPLVTALGVNDQTERPHLVFKDGKTYLFSISHNSTSVMVPNNQPDGVLGWISEEGVFGKYKPMNNSALVLGNPPTAPLQTYSHYGTIDPNTGIVYFQSFINYLPDPSQTWPDYYDPATYRIGGTLAPTVGVTLEGERSFVTSVEDYAVVNTYGEWAQDLTWDIRPAVAPTTPSSKPTSLSAPSIEP